jgi:hypothetical protein
LRRVVGIDGMGAMNGAISLGERLLGVAVAERILIR